MNTSISTETILNEAPPFSYSRVVKIWLMIGIAMVFVQVVVGGITRLTGSGLSITKWEIVTGTLPPLNQQQWEEAFDLYKATPQYQKINDGMSMGSFKFIYFWEYIHRLWARLMGFVFAIPFFYFLSRRMLDSALIRRLLVVILLAGIVASFGWIMVESGLHDRPWVNAYKLTMHLSLALTLFGYLLWTTFTVVQPRPQVINNQVLKNVGLAFTIILAVQIILGGIMSGMKAGLVYPTWPDMNGVLVPDILLNHQQWTVENFVNYDSSAFAPALVQILHRSTAYLLTIIGLVYFVRGIKAIKIPVFRRGILLLISMLVIQVLLGISTLINCIGTIPVGLGVLHQAGALILLGIALFMNYQLSAKSY